MANMALDDWIKLLDAFTKLFSATVWPLLILLCLILFRSSLTSFFANLSEFTFKGAGFEASAKRAATAIANLSAANEKTPDTRTSTSSIVEAVSDVTPSVVRRAQNTTALWVDDNPGNNSYERAALEAIGISFVLSTSTEDALAKLNQQSFDLVISDMSRPPDHQAGFALLDAMRNAGKKIPFIIYAASSTPEFVAQAIKRGAFGETNRPDELFKLVVSAIKK
jgi:CheY-like chemotaxis protein